jgi:Tfp pilus assembly protein PilZ
MSSDREKRRHPRIPREEILSMKLIAPPTEFAHQGEPLYCSTEDVSAEGMRIHVNHELEPGQAVDIWIVLLDHRGTFHLTGEVTWIHPASEVGSAGTWVAGVVLLDDSEHLREWRELFLEE